MPAVCDVHKYELVSHSKCVNKSVLGTLAKLRFNYCVCVKRKTLYNCLCSSSRFSASRVLDFGIVNRYFWFWKQGINVRTDMRTDISIPIRAMTTKFGKQVSWHLGELTQIRLIKQVLLTPSYQDHMTN